MQVAFALDTPDALMPVDSPEVYRSKYFAAEHLHFVCKLNERRCSSPGVTEESVRLLIMNIMLEYGDHFQR